MTQTAGTRVYILGAGCSAAYGYPLAKTFVDGLESFGSELQEGSTQIKKCVEATAHLMKKGNRIETIDELVYRINHGVFDESNRDNPTTHYRRIERILEAKIATTAYLFSKESAARQSGLAGYTSLLHLIFGQGSNWEDKLKRSDARILSFNYDRLFEIALLKSLNPDIQTFGLYSGAVLNTGLDYTRNTEVRFESNRFSFLKLHGSAGISVRRDRGDTEHYYKVPNDGGDATLSDSALGLEQDSNSPLSERLQPMIVFPHEKHEYFEHPTFSGLHKEYVTKVWNRAMSLISGAREVWIIGYSFAPIDRKSWLKILQTIPATARIVIQNPDAGRICRSITIQYPEFQGRLEHYEEYF